MIVTYLIIINVFIFMSGRELDNTHLSFLYLIAFILQLNKNKFSNYIKYQYIYNII